ncbi:MAG: ATP-binding cassette domain-containing protein [Flavobacteriales bacterium]|nr:ATP-binding cassette domain-containing protein [Flavobacteriales bacterium]MBT4881980.1 ATP-binding cassette domain-containing protein [Flavobacteriales bacterium]MDG1348777.1 ATP-binding cassette domain-containing protein [Flavobacteriales bacterium]|tara:strand:- start:2642 stop:3325 length:684 start_codon:yes stop_codon:yes gene_type:complete
MNKPIINLEGVDIHQMNHQVFSNITLKVNAGDFLYLIGETGSGKSSLLKALYGELKVSAGNISLTEIDLNKIKAKEIPNLRRKLGIVFQDFQLLSDRNVFENLSFVLKATGWKDKTKISDRINEVLKSVHLNDVKDKMPYALSGGEQQRAAIARSLLNNPEIILADEPTGNLDPEKSNKIIELLQEINAKGTTILIATHDYSIIKKYKARTLQCANQKISEIVMDHE